MIKINLLPFRLAQEKEKIRKQISIFFLWTLFICLVLFLYTIHLNKQIRRVQETTQFVYQQIAIYKEKTNRVKRIKEDLKILNEKLSVVSQLREQQSKQLVLFDSMTGLIVPGKMWLEHMNTNETMVIIKGIAFDNHTVADFMEKLEASPLFNKVDLKTAKLKKFKGDVMLKSFELFCQKEKPVQEKAKDE